MDIKPGSGPISEQVIAYVQIVIDCIDAVIAICDADKTVIMINRAGRTLLKKEAKMEPEALLGHPIDEVLKPLIADGKSVVAMAAELKRPMRRNVQYIISNKTILYTAVPVLENGELRYIIATGRDMTKLVQLEEQLAAAERLNNYFSVMMRSLAQHDEPESIISSSKKMEDTLKLAMRASMSDASVFITGESGVGKEEIAKYIHENSPRSERPFIAVNCSAIPKALIESELFGYAEGAFTGSKKGGKPGLVEEADGGTFFLDEIGDLPIDVQSKLLRVIQEEAVRRIGSTVDKPVDVRYISATNMNPEKLLDNSVFRQDLRYRLSVIPIHVPPIRERREDIIPLVEYFTKYFNKKYHKEIRLTAAAHGFLCGLPWQGNVRQIKNVVERIVILCEDGQLLKEDLIPILNMDIENLQGGAADKVKVSEITTLTEARGQLEKQLIDMALEEYKTIPKAAKALGVPPSTLYRKLKK